MFSIRNKLSTHNVINTMLFIFPLRWFHNRFSSAPPRLDIYRRTYFDLAKIFARDKTKILVSFNVAGSLLLSEVR